MLIIKNDVVRKQFGDLRFKLFKLSCYVGIDELHSVAGNMQMDCGTHLVQDYH